MGLIDVLMLTLLAGTAIAIILMRDLFAAAMLSGIFSLLSAGLFVVMDAPDVAFTEAAVGAGISTILLLSALSLTSAREKASSAHFQWVPLLVVLVTGAALVFGTLDMPVYGDPDAPIHRHVAPRYIEESPHEIGIPNMVTSVLASYRGYDTLGETAVVFTAAVGVLLLLRRRGRARDPVAGPDRQPSGDRAA
jgi:multicomponent Na+:H+ antiporter subunit B